MDLTKWKRFHGRNPLSGRKQILHNSLFLDFVFMSLEIFEKGNSIRMRNLWVFNLIGPMVVLIRDLFCEELQDQLVTRYLEKKLSINVILTRKHFHDHIFYGCFIVTVSWGDMCRREWQGCRLSPFATVNRVLWLNINFLQIFILNYWWQSGVCQVIVLVRICLLQFWYRWLHMWNMQWLSGTLSAK